MVSELLRLSLRSTELLASQTWLTVHDISHTAVVIVSTSFRFGRSTPYRIIML